MSFSNIKIGTRLLSSFGLIAIFILIVGIVGFKELLDVERKWDSLQEVTLHKSQTVSEGSAALADGIQHFKDYILRGQDYEQKFLSDMNEIDKAVATYSSVAGISAVEKDALLRINKGAVSYREAIKSAVGMKAAGRSITDIDAAIKGADKPIKQALRELAEIIKKETNAAGIAIDQLVSVGKWWTSITAASAIAVSFLLAWLVSRSITKPLHVALLVARTVANGDLTSVIRPGGKDETAQLLEALRDMNHHLIKIVSNVRTGTDTIATASSQIAAGNMDLSSRTEEQASSLEETASFMEELTATVKQNADNAHQANQLAVSASDVAIRGGTVVSQVIDTMSEINASAKKIADIISVIDGIAFQTNILALNAAVEAARAEEQGRGFAVVASEVRNLAQRSAAAAKEIKALISDSVGKVDVGTKLVAQAGSTMDEVVGGIKRVTDMMREITAASQEQSAGIEQVNQAIGQMDQVTQQNSALVEEAAAAAESLQDQTSNLVQVVSVFKLVASAPGQRVIPVQADAVALSSPGCTSRATKTGKTSVTARSPALTPRALAPATGENWA